MFIYFFYVWLVCVVTRGVLGFLNFSTEYYLATVYMHAGSLVCTKTNLIQTGKRPLSSCEIEPLSDDVNLERVYGRPLESPFTAPFEKSRRQPKYRKVTSTRSHCSASRIQGMEVIANKPESRPNGRTKAAK